MVFPHCGFCLWCGDKERDATAALAASGGTVVGTVKHPLGETDFSSYLLEAQANRPDVLALANGGIDTINSIKQAAEFGLTRSERTNRRPSR